MDATGMRVTFDAEAFQDLITAIEGLTSALERLDALGDVDVGLRAASRGMAHAMRGLAATCDVIEA